MQTIQSLPSTVSAGSAASLNGGALQAARDQLARITAAQGCGERRGARADRILAATARVGTRHAADACTRPDPDRHGSDRRFADFDTRGGPRCNVVA